MRTAHVGATNRNTQRNKKITVAYKDFYLSLIFSLVPGMGLACVFIGLVIRVFVTYLLVHFGGFTLKEKLFIAIAWLPKATVQVCVSII